MLKTNKNDFIKLLIVGAALGASASVFAYEKGDIQLRFGLATVSPDDDSSDVSVNGVPVAGTGIEVQGDTTLDLTITYFQTDKLAYEVLLVTPFSNDIDSEDMGGLKIGDTDTLPPTFSVLYYPVGTDDDFKPYVGAGINYTIYLSPDVSDDFEAALGSADLDISDSVGIALQAGVDYEINENWGVNAAIRYIQIEADATIKLKPSGTKIEVTSDIDPFVFQVNAVYSF